MKTNVMIVRQDGVAVRYDSKGETGVVKAQGIFLPSLYAIKEVLNTIPTDSIVDTTTIYVADALRGLCTGNAIEYVKTGKTASGTALTQDEINAVKEVYELYGSRILNVVFKEIKFIKRDDVALQDLKKQALAELNKQPKSAGSAGTQTIMVDPSADIRAMLQEAYKTALTAMDTEKMMFLMEQLKSLPAPVAQTVTSGSPGTRPSFDSVEDLVNYHTNDVEQNTGEVVDNTTDKEQTPVFQEGTQEITW